MTPAFHLVLPFLLAAVPGSSPATQPHHPTVYLTAAEAARARQRIASDPAAKAWFKSLCKGVDQWSDQTPEWVRGVVPEPGACFAYGFTGCPICGATWGTWGDARASFDNPGHVTCANGHGLPDADHPDPGTGYVGKDKRIHYFVGSYNAWVVETLIFKIAEPDATIWLLNRDDHAGRMAAVILDEIARIYPSCDKGSWDYPSNPPSGRLDRPWYQVARVLVHLVDMYDRVYDHPAMEEPSSVPGLTRRQNIEKNLLLNGAKYCCDESHRTARLHNGQADYLRGVLSVGVLLDLPEYITWPVDGAYGIRAMLANNIDRDGQYYETSNGYSLHTRNLYVTFAGPLRNYRGSVYPDGLNLYDDPRFQAFMLLPQMSLVCHGQNPSFGDDPPATTRRPPPYHPPRCHDSLFTEYLVCGVSDAAKRAEYASLLRYLRSRGPDAAKQIRDTEEMRVFHGPDAAVPDERQPGEVIRQRLDGSFFFGQKGLAVMRLGKDASAQAAILRFGPSLNHGHLDDLNVNYYARGYELTYDLGYSLGSTHTQVGWAHATASHNVVVVDEKSQGGSDSGGSLHYFADLPGLVLAEGSSTAYGHIGVDTYRRLFVLTDEYALDVFRVRGGKQHDLLLHSASTEVDFDGLSFDAPRPGSLAGAQYQWGDLQLNDGDMKGYPNKPYWNPPPGNGYGFLVQSRFAQPAGHWSATWRLKDQDDTRFQMLALHNGSEQVISAVAPGLYPRLPKAGYVIRRRAGDELSSCFISVWQSGTGTTGFPVQWLRLADRPGNDNRRVSVDEAMAIEVALANRTRDLWLLTPDSRQEVDSPCIVSNYRLKGAIARWRTVNARPTSRPVYAPCDVPSGEMVAADLVAGSRLAMNDNAWVAELDAPSRTAKVAALPGGSPAIEIDSEWPADGRYDGCPLYVTNPAYSRNSAYVIDRVEGRSIRIRQANTLLGRGLVGEIRDEHRLMSRIPHEYACCMGNCSTSTFFQGKLLRAADGSAATHITRTALPGMMEIGVESSAGFKVDQPIVYHDVQPGDTVTVDHYLSVRRIDEGRYELRTNTDMILYVRNSKAIKYVDGEGKVVTAENGRIPRASLPRSGLTSLSVIR